MVKEISGAFFPAFPAMKNTMNEKKELQMYNANRCKIILFPGVSLNMANNVQSENIFTTFLNELGYIENRETPDRFHNELDDFLCEMGYIE